MRRLVPLLLLVACGKSDIVILQDKGSDTMVNLMQLLSEGYLGEGTKVVVAVTGGGSGTGIKSLIDGTTDMANASRPMSEKEIKLAEERGGDDGAHGSESEHGEPQPNRPSM